MKPILTITFLALVCCWGQAPLQIGMDKVRQAYAAGYRDGVTAHQTKTTNTMSGGWLMYSNRVFTPAFH